MSEDRPRLIVDWRLRFDPVRAGTSALDFPCCEHGEVDLNALDEAQRHAYFFARITRGIHNAPRVIRTDDH